MTTVLIAQINTTPNDFQGNFNKIKENIETAIAKNCSLVVFPELTIPGYLIKDIVYNEDFIEKNLATLDQVCRLTVDNKKLHALVGYVSKNNSGAGKPFYNSVAVINNGNVIATYNKWLLPFYDVFDESRYYEAGKDLCVIKIEGKRFGIAVCEDLWNCKGQDDYNHHNNPIQKYRDLNVDWIISLNASPFVEGKPLLRKNMLEKIADGNFGIIYVNQIGGQDELVFDGHSFVMDNHGLMKAYIQNDLKPAINSQGMTDIVNLNGPSGKYMIVDNDDVLKMILLGLYDYSTKSGFKSFVTGSSGGIDSAVVLALAAFAFGHDAVHGIRMPSKWSSDGSKNDALDLHNNLGIHDYLVPIDHDPVIDHFNTNLGINQNDNYNKVADENIQARIRGQVVMHFSNAKGALALTTTNKTENALGYGTLFGDLAGTLNPLGDLYKRQVYDIARRLNAIAGKAVIPVTIIDKAPSAELAPGQTDEAALMPYIVLDRLVEAYVEHYIRHQDTFVEWLVDFHVDIYKKLPGQLMDILTAKYDAMIRRVDIMEFKRRQTAPCFKVSRKAFGSGRRLPIVKK